MNNSAESPQSPTQWENDMNNSAESPQSPTQWENDKKNTQNIK